MKGCELHLSFLSLVCDGFCLFYCEREGWGWKSVSAPHPDFPSQEYCYHLFTKSKTFLSAWRRSRRILPCQLKRRREEEGAEGIGSVVCCQAGRAPRSEPSLPGARLPGQEKCERLLPFVPFLSKWLDSGKPSGEQECWAKRACVMPERGGVPVTAEKPLKGRSQHSPGHQRFPGCRAWRQPPLSHCRLTHTTGFPRTTQGFLGIPGSKHITLFMTTITAPSKIALGGEGKS